MDKVRIKLNSTRGIDQIVLLNNVDRRKIIELEGEDEKVKSVLFGKKNNLGVKQVLDCDVMMAFMTNKEFGWPANNIKLMHGDKIIGGDVTDPVKLQEYQEHSGYCVFGNIVVELDKLVKKGDSADSICMVVNPKPFPHIGHIPGISDALMASPSRFTDEYIRSRLHPNSKEQCIGSFLLGFNIKNHIFGNSAECTSVRGSVY
ncbi:hypothetical protein J7W08_04215 [Methanococcoides orientis]|uniref:hypothetical protein n=1 Tax=Methanococcoides orientis TaxID=2822137 RepID=UPI001E64DAEF|nr:hypothetical protein [Methanococcoides orientis]UGV41501.1 hypothetical protein J7W08_04215 [Methanococcoides orientis]